MSSKIQYHRHRIMAGLRAAMHSGAVHPAHALLLADAHFKAMRLSAPRAVWRDIAYPGVLAILARQPGMTVSDPHGLAIQQLSGWVPLVSRGAVGLMVRDAVKEGHVERVQPAGGRRTYSVTLTQAGFNYIGGQLAPPPEFWVDGYEPGGRFRPAPPVEQVAAPPAVNYDERLGRLALDLAARVEAKDQQIAEMEQHISALVVRLGDAHDEINRLRARPAAPADNGHGEYPVRDLLSDEQRAALERLMQEIPTSR